MREEKVPNKFIRVINGLFLIDLNQLEATRSTRFYGNFRFSLPEVFGDQRDQLFVRPAIDRRRFDVGQPRPVFVLLEQIDA